MHEVQSHLQKYCLCGVELFAPNAQHGSRASTMYDVFQWMLASRSSVCSASWTVGACRMHAACMPHWGMQLTVWQAGPSVVTREVLKLVHLA
jgi:hypothetical protein